MITDVQRQNLEKLATYLEGLPADYEHFNMLMYMRGRIGWREEIDYALNNGGVAKCGTAACAVGHGPAAGILFLKSEIDNFGLPTAWVDWNSYAQRNFVDDIHGPVYDWLFSAAWNYTDNTPHGAAARIRCYLDKGVPAEFSYAGLCDEIDGIVDMYQEYLK